MIRALRVPSQEFVLTVSAVLLQPLCCIGRAAAEDAYARMDDAIARAEERE